MPSKYCSEQVLYFLQMKTSSSSGYKAQAIKNICDTDLQTHGNVCTELKDEEGLIITQTRKKYSVVLFSLS